MSQKRINLVTAVQAVPEPEPVEITFGELVAAFTARHFERGLGARLRKWVDLLGTQPAWSINSEQIERGRDAMVAAGYKVSAVNRDLSAIGEVYLFAASKRMTPRGFVRPTLGIRREKEPPRIVHIESQTYERLLAGARAHADRRFELFVRLAVDTGARAGELYPRTWGELDTERRQIVLWHDATKTGAARTLFFSEATATLIERLRPKGEGAAARLVFESERRASQAKSYRKAWDELRRDVGRPDLHVHDLRHGAAARLLRAGVTAGVAAQVLGHDVAVLSRRYGHLEAAALQEAQERAWKGAA